MSVARTLWAMLHPGKLYETAQVERVLQDCRAVLLRTAVDIENPHLTAKQRFATVSRINKIVKQLDKILA